MKAERTWRIASCRDRWAKYGLDAHASPTANIHDAVAAVELALAEAEALLGHPLIDDCQADEQTGEIPPALTIVTDNGSPFRSLTVEAFIAVHSELRHVRTRVRTPGQNGSRERGFGTMKSTGLPDVWCRPGIQVPAAIIAQGRVRCHAVRRGAV